MREKVFCILFFCYVINSNLFSQAEYIDSLKNRLQADLSDTAKARLYNRIGYYYQKRNVDTSLYYYYLNIHSISSNPEIFKDDLLLLKTDALQSVGWIYGTQKAQFDTALMLIQESLSILNRLKNSKDTTILKKIEKGIASGYNNLGGINDNLGKYDLALYYYLKSLGMYEANKDTRGIANCLGNIGIVQSSLKNYSKSLSYFKQALKLREELKDTRGIANTYNNIGGVYVYIEQYDTAFEYYSKALKIFEEIKLKRGIVSCYVNLGVISKYQKNYKSAIDYYQKAISIYEELGDKQKLALIYNNIASFYIELMQFQSALEYAEKAKQLAIEVHALPEENESYFCLKQAYSGLGNSKKALENAEKYIATKDSMFKQEKTLAITEMETKYQSEKKQLEIEKLGKEKELQSSEMKKQQIIILFVISGLFFVLGFSIVLFRMFVQKKKANKLITEKNETLQIAYEEINMQKEEILVQRDNIQKQKDIIEENQKEIEDSINYAKRIQQAVMPNLEFGSWNLEFGSFILFKPKDIVSGDFYWATKVNEWLIVTVADCTGHGVPGAFMSMLGISFLNEIVRKKEITKASDVLNELRTSVIDALKQKGASGEQKDGMDIGFCAINTETLEMQFAGANNPCWIIDSHPSSVVSPLIELKPDKQPIGIHTNMQPFTNQIYQLQKGDTIYLMSDGYEDQFGGPNRKKFLSKHLKTLLQKNSKQTLVEQKQILETTISEWIGDNEQIDDITLLGIRT